MKHLAILIALSIATRADRALMGCGMRSITMIDRITML